MGLSGSDPGAPCDPYRTHRPPEHRKPEQYPPHTEKNSRYSGYIEKGIKTQRLFAGSLEMQREHISSASQAMRAVDGF